MKGLAKVSIHFFLVLGLLLFSLRPSVTGRMGPEGSNAGINPSSIGSLHTDSAPKNAIHYRTSFSSCEKKNLHRPAVPARFAVEIGSDIFSSLKSLPIVVSKAVPSVSSPVLRI